MRHLISLLAVLVASTAFADDVVKVQGRKGTVVVGADGSVKVDDGEGGTVDVGADGRVRIDSGARHESESVELGGEDVVSLAHNGQKGAYDCGGGQATLYGNQNRITFTNCSLVSVLGNQNKVALASGAGVLEILGNGNVAFVELLSDALLAGSHNSLEWVAGAEGRTPGIRSTGRGNKVSER